MRKELAQVVFALFKNALQLREDVQRGKSPDDIPDAQHKLSSLLDDVRAESADDERIENALVYWLDEIFVDSD